MPSFRVAARWVRDAQRPEPVRFTAFCWALESYYWLTGQRFHATYRRLGHHLGFDWQRRPSGAQMVQALAVLERERERLKAKQARARERRRAEKRQGRRAFPRSHYTWVFEPDFLELPHPLVAI